MKYYVAVIGCAYVLMRETPEGKIQFYRFAPPSPITSMSLTLFEANRSWHGEPMMAWPYGDTSDIYRMLTIVGETTSPMPARLIVRLNDINRFMEDKFSEYEAGETTKAGRILEL